MPFSLSTDYLPQKLFPGLETVDLRRASLYKTLENKYGVNIAHSRRYIDISSAGSDEAGFLNMKKGSPVFKIESISYLKGDVPFECFTSIHPGGRTRFVIELIGQEPYGNEYRQSADSMPSGVYIIPHKLDIVS